MHENLQLFRTANKCNLQSEMSYNVLKSTCATKTKKNALGSAENLRVGRVTRNRHIFYFGLK